MINPALALIAVSGDDQPAAAMPPWLSKVGGPLGFAGRVCGLGQEEMQAGIPAWAWALGGFAVGAAVMYVAAPSIRAAVGGYSV